jgi:hypothetical protein
MERPWQGMEVLKEIRKREVWIKRINIKKTILYIRLRLLKIRDEGKNLLNRQEKRCFVSKGAIGFIITNGGNWLKVPKEKY